MKNHRKLVAYNQYEKELHKGKTTPRRRNCRRWRLMRRAFIINWEAFHERYI